MSVVLDFGWIFGNLDFKVLFGCLDFKSQVIIGGTSHSRIFSTHFHSKRNQKVNQIISHNDHKLSCIFHCHVDSICHRSSLVRLYLFRNHLIDFVLFSFYGILVYC